MSSRLRQPAVAPRPRSTAPPRRGSPARRRPGRRTGAGARVLRHHDRGPATIGPNSTGTRRAASATTRRPAAGRRTPRPEPLARARGAEPSGPSSASSSSAHTGTPVSTQRDQQRVGDEVARAEAAVDEPVQHRLPRSACGRRRGRCPPGGRTRGRRAGPARWRSATACAPWKRLESIRSCAPSARRGCARRAPSPPATTAAGPGTPRRRRGRPSRAHRARRSSRRLPSGPAARPSTAWRHAPVELAVADLAELVLCARPPPARVGDLRADGDAVEVGQDAVAVVADRERPAALADEVARRRRGRRGSATAANCTPGWRSRDALAGGRARARTPRRVWRGRPAPPARARRARRR